MAGSGKRGVGDRVLESRHLVGLFLGVVVLCGVFFTLGYVMGKTQYAGAVHAASSPDLGAPMADAPAKPNRAAPSAAAPAPNSDEWDFYGKKQDADDHLQPALKPSSPSASASLRSAARSDSAPDRSGRTLPAAARFRAPRITNGAIVLQVAALTHEGDALAMAEVLQQKRFPSFVVKPTKDNFYRVQVGPYRNERAAEIARHTLERAGFRAIMKR
jgi:DedD protein